MGLNEWVGMKHGLANSKLWKGGCEINSAMGTEKKVQESSIRKEIERGYS